MAGSLAAGVGVTLQREPAADEPASPTGRRTIRRQSRPRAASCSRRVIVRFEPATVRHHRGHGLALHAEFRRPSPLGRCPGINKQCILEQPRPFQRNGGRPHRPADPDVAARCRRATREPAEHHADADRTGSRPLSHAATRPRPAGPQEPTASGGHRHQAGGGQRTTPVVLVRFLFGRKWKNSLPTAWSESGTLATNRPAATACRHGKSRRNFKC